MNETCAGGGGAPSAIHAPLTGLFFITTAPERSTQPGGRFSPSFPRRHAEIETGWRRKRKPAGKTIVLETGEGEEGNVNPEVQQSACSCKQGQSGWRHQQRVNARVSAPGLSSSVYVRPLFHVETANRVLDFMRFLKYWWSLDYPYEKTDCDCAFWGVSFVQRIGLGEEVSWNPKMFRVSRICGVNVS